MHPLSFYFNIENSYSASRVLTLEEQIVNMLVKVFFLTKLCLKGLVHSVQEQDTK